jgi:hypothetical protein
MFCPSNTCFIQLSGVPVTSIHTPLKRILPMSIGDTTRTTKRQKPLENSESKAAKRKPSNDPNVKLRSNQNAGMYPLK